MTQTWPGAGDGLLGYDNVVDQFPLVRPTLPRRSLQDDKPTPVVITEIDLALIRQAPRCAFERFSLGASVLPGKPFH